METLPHSTEPQLPEAWVFTCERDECGEPIALWNPHAAPADPRSAEDDVNTQDLLGPSRPTLCPDCAIALATPDRQAGVFSLFVALWRERQVIGRPPGTLIAFELPVESGPLYLYGLGVEDWPPYLPQFVLPWNVPGCPPKIVLFSVWGAVQQWAVGSKFMMRWSWESPESPPWYEIMPPAPGVPPTQVQWKALGAALSQLGVVVANAMGRPPDDPDAVCADFERRLPEAIRVAREEMARNGEPRNRLLRQKDLADAFGWDVKTLRDRLRPPCRRTWESVSRMQGSRALSERD